MLPGYHMQLIVERKAVKVRELATKLVIKKTIK